jgi:transposase
MRRDAAHDLVYCVDLAQNKFQIHAFKSTGERIQQRTLSRSRFERFFSSPHGGGAVVVMEACASGHFWSRQLLRNGYHPKLVPPQFAAMHRMGNKTDGNDADAIYATHRDLRVGPVPIKTLEQQDTCAQHRLRELLVRQRVQCINQARGLLAERGIIAIRGDKGFRGLLRRALGFPSEEMTPILARLLTVLGEQLKGIEERIAELDRELEVVVAESEVATRIRTVFGVGSVTATAIVGEYGSSVGRYSNARQFAASIGITPKEHSSGERRRLGKITKRGNPYLRWLLMQCAQTIILNCHRRENSLCQFARALIERRKHRNTVRVAVANRLARIIYALMRTGQEYQPVISVATR